jgi:hypothetical protein
MGAFTSTTHSSPKKLPNATVMPSIKICADGCEELIHIYKSNVGPYKSSIHVGWRVSPDTNDLWRFSQFGHRDLSSVCKIAMDAIDLYLTQNKDTLLITTSWSPCVVNVDRSTDRVARTYKDMMEELLQDMLRVEDIFDV